MKIYKAPQYTIRGTHYVTKLKGKLIYYAESLLYGTAIAALTIDGALMVLGEPTVGKAIRTNLEYTNKLNDKTIKEHAKEIAELKGQEKIDAIEDYYAQAVFQNPNIPTEHKAEIITAYSYNVIERIGEKFDEETISRLIARASTETYREAAEKLDSKNDGIFRPMLNQITVRDASHKKTNAHEQNHGVGVGLRKGTYGRGLDEGTTSFLSNDTSYAELQRFSNIIGSIIGYDKLRDCYMTEGLDSVVKELEKYTSRDNVRILLIRMDQIYDFGYDQYQQLLDSKDPTKTANRKQICINSANGILKGMMKKKYGTKADINLSKVLIDYSNVGNKVAELYGDMVYGLDELTIIFGHDTMEDIFKSGNVEALKDLMSNYLTTEEAEACINAMEQNFNVSYVYSLNNGKTPDVFPKETSQYDDQQYRQNEETYKGHLSEIFRKTGHPNLAEILSKSRLHDSSSVYTIKLDNWNRAVAVIDYYSGINTNGENNTTYINTEIPIGTDELKKMNTEDFRNFISEKIASSMKITPGDIEEATQKERTEQIKRVREEIDGLMEPRLPSKGKGVSNIRDLEG